jgi:hypothetical protein
VVQIWPGQTVTCLHTNRPGHIWTTLYYCTAISARYCGATNKVWKQNNLMTLFWDTLYTGKTQVPCKLNRNQVTYEYCNSCMKVMKIPFCHVSVIHRRNVTWMKLRQRRFLLNVGSNLPSFMASHLWRLQFWERESALRYRTHYDRVSTRLEAETAEWCVKDFTSNHYINLCPSNYQPTC